MGIALLVSRNRKSDRGAPTGGGRDGDPPDQAGRTAKGDGVLGIYKQLRTPVRFVGAGADADDPALFESKQLVGGLFP